MEHVQEYDVLIAKRMFRDGYSEKDVAAYLTSKYGKVNSSFVHKLRMDVEGGNGGAY